MSERRRSRGALWILIVCGVTVAIGVLTRASTLDAAAQTLPSPWTSADVGAPAVPGYTTGDGTSFEIAGTGTDIWGTSDQFQFAYQPLAGDVTITARVTNVYQADTWSKAGLMIRASLARDAANAFVFNTAISGRGFQRRLTSGGNSDWTPGCACPPGWVRLTRAGNVFTAYDSPDGQNWRAMGSQTISMPSTVYVGLAVTAHTPAAVAAYAAFDKVSVAGATTVTPPVDAVWSTRDIGLPLLAGSFTNLAGVLTVRGGGLDIWGLLDQFHFVSQAVTGDTQIVARVDSFQAPHIWSKAGVMIRSDLSGGAPNAAMLAFGGGDWDFQRRLAPNGESYYTPAGPGTVPGWVKLVRERNLFTAYRSNDGVQWTAVGSEVITMPSTVYVGLAVSSHDLLSLATATMSNVSVGAPTAVNQPPSIQLSAPSVATAPATIALAATAGDADGNITWVDFYANGQLIASDNTSPYAATWTGVPAGAYVLAAVATDDDGATAVSVTALTVSATSARPTTVVFVPSLDYATNVTSTSVELRRSSDATSAAPVAAVSLGKPAVISGEIVVDITALVDPLPAGSYYAVIVSTGPGGSTPSAPSAVFSK